MWFLATRNRPDAVRDLIASMRAAGEVPEVAVMVDGPTYGDFEWPEHWHIHHSEEHLEVQRAFNALYALYPNESFYGWMVDHCRFDDPNWASEMQAMAGDWNIAVSNDVVRANPTTGFPRLTSCVAFGGKLIKALGYVYPDFCVHFYGDDALEEIGYGVGILRTPGKSLVRSLYAHKGEFPRDANHDRIWRGRHYLDDDRVSFLKWRDEKKPGILAKLDALIPAGERSVPRRPDNVEKFYVCCVNAQNYLGRGVEYVNTLYDMISRNLPAGFAGEFVCFTDTRGGKGEYHPNIDVSPLPVEGLKGWWNKLALFGGGIFPDGARVWFFDLDTAIIGALDDIFAYKGEFATLKDFYYPSRVGPAIMSWRVGALSKSIWEEWDGQGRPTDGHGDLWWINNLDQGRFAKNCDKLQNLFPDSFVSFKVHCQPYPPRGSAVVCFHGEPRPHEADVHWVKDVWKVGGMTTAAVRTFCNVPDSELEKNIRTACAMDVPWLWESKPHKQEAVIVGGGPSLRDSIGMIKTRQKSGHKVFALNNSAKMLAENGVITDYQIIMDARPENAEFIKSSPAKTFIIASQASPETWNAAYGHDVILFHASIPGIREIIGQDAILVGGGTTVLTRAMAIVHFMGFRYQHLYGVDSSFQGEAHHAYEQSLNADKPSDVFVSGRAFKSCPWMIAQVDEFQTVARALADEDAVISVHGDGLLPYVAQLMAA